MENNNIKINFFQKIKIAIFNLEKYSLFITERLNKSIKYMLILILIFTICNTILYTYDVSKMADNGLKYVENDLPDFTLIDGVIKFDNDVNGYDEKYDFKIVNIEKDEIENNELSEFLEYSSALILLNKKIIFVSNGQSLDYSYNYIQESFRTEINNKEQLIEAFNNLGGKTQIISIISITLLTTFFVANIYQIVIECLIVALYGYMVARINRIKIKFPTVITLAIYSLTLSVILNLIYVFVYYFTAFEIPYFEWLYLIIAYIYITAAILMIKTDLIKQLIELKKIEEEQKNVKKEIEEKEELGEKTPNDKKEKEQDEKKEDLEIDREPDGSEI